MAKAKKGPFIFACVYQALTTLKEAITYEDNSTLSILYASIAA